MSLFEVETYLLLGHYQSAINAASKIRPDPKKGGDATAALVQARDFFVYRAHVEQGNASLVLDEINENSAASLKGVKLLAQFSSGRFDPEQLAGAANDLATQSANDGPLQTVLGLLFLKLNKTEDGLRVLHNTNSLEGRAILIQLYLVMNRLDLAVRELARMQAQKDDAIPTQLAAAWVALAHGREKARRRQRRSQSSWRSMGPRSPC